MLNSQTTEMAIDQRQESAAIEESAKTAAMKSPHPTLLAKSELSSGDTNPATRKFIPRNLIKVRPPASITAMVSFACVLRHPKGNCHRSSEGKNFRRHRDLKTNHHEVPSTALPTSF
jgi:hypothetical protein